MPSQRENTPEIMQDDGGAIVLLRCCVVVVVDCIGDRRSRCKEEGIAGRRTR